MERRSISSDATDTKTNISSNLSTKPSVSTSALSNADSITAINMLDLIKIRLYTTRGKMIELEVLKNLSGSQLKRQAILQLLYTDNPSAVIPTSVIDLSYLIISKGRQRLDDNVTLRDMDINNNDELVLVQNVLKVADHENLKGPLLSDILEATENVPLTRNPPPRVDIVEVVPQNDPEFDFRMVLMTLAQSAAYVIGAGPFAERMISMLKSRLLKRVKPLSDSAQALIDMGFNKEDVAQALQETNDEFTAGLEWLIENQSRCRLENSSTQECNISTEIGLDTTNKRVAILLEIIRINCYRYEMPDTEMVNSLIDMGFVEESIIEALKVTQNNQAAACEWLTGNRSRSLTELRDGLPPTSPILNALLESPQIQISLGNPKIFLAYISMLENYSSLDMWLSDNDTSGILGHILRTYYEAKTISAINRFTSV